MEEEWRDLEGYEGLYQVSNLGRVKALERVITLPEKILEGTITENGYVQVRLTKDKTAKSELVHRLVANTFIPNPDNKPDVNHKLGIKTDNRVTELEWNTKSENQLHAYRVLGKKSNYKPQKGENNGLSKLTWIQIQEIKALLAMNISQRKIAKQYNVSQVTISNINQNKIWIQDNLS